MIMTAYIGNKPISHVLYFNWNINSVINVCISVFINYVNYREEVYEDTFVILCNPGIYLDGIWYTSFNDIPDT